MSGSVNVNKMLRRITAKQFVEWECYARLEPFGEMRADWRAASIREMIYNVAVVKKDRKPLEDFLLNFEQEDPSEKKHQTWQEQFEIAKLIAYVYSGPAVDE